MEVPGQVKGQPVVTLALLRLDSSLAPMVGWCFLFR